MPDTFPLDPRDPEAAIAAAAKRCSNWGRWGADDVHGTLNFLDDAKRRDSRRAHPSRGELLPRPVVRRQRPAEGLAAAHQPGAHHARHRRRRRARQPGLPARNRRGRRRDLHAAAGLHPMGRPWAHLRPRQRLERSPGRRCGDQRGRPGDRDPDRDRPDQWSWCAARRRSGDRRERRTARRFRHHHRAPRWRR